LSVQAVAAISSAPRESARTSRGDSRRNQAAVPAPVVLHVGDVALDLVAVSIQRRHSRPARPTVRRRREPAAQVLVVPSMPPPPAQRDPQAPVSVAISTIAAGLYRQAYASASARSASPRRRYQDLDGLARHRPQDVPWVCTRPLGMFSVAGSRATMFSGSLSAAAFPMAPSTGRRPNVVLHLVHALAGLIEIPPESKVMVLPTSATQGRLPPPRYSTDDEGRRLHAAGRHAGAGLPCRSPHLLPVPALHAEPVLPAERTRDPAHVRRRHVRRGGSRSRAIGPTSDDCRCGAAGHRGLRC